MHINFGKYQVPTSLQALIDFKRELGDSERFYEVLHFYLTLSDFRYFNTPSDVIVFGHTGADGIHYGFLTDFGACANLEDAPIVSICPMSFDEPTRIIANNLREFLAINFTDNGLFYNTFVSEEHYEAYKNKYPNTQQQVILEQLKARLDLPHIESPYRYVEALRCARQQLVTIKTQDRLGVTAPLTRDEMHIPFPIDEDDVIDLEKLKVYLTVAPIPSQHAVFRDIQRHYVLNDYTELKELVQQAMRKIGLVDEAARLD